MSDDSIDRRHLPTVAGFRFFKSQHIAGSMRVAQLTLLDQVLNAWADTSNLAERMEDRTTQYRFRFMAIGSVRRSKHVTAVGCWMKISQDQVCKYAETTM